MQIHQVVVSASPGDAITNEALELRSVLRQVCESDIYARYIDPAMVSETIPLSRFGRRAGSDPATDVLVFHASIGEPDVLAFLWERPERLVLRYHNISPPEAFRDYDPAFAGLLEAGRDELAALASRTTLGLAVSQYNADELIALGYGDVRCAPLVVDLERVRATEPDWGTDNHLRTQIHGPVLLTVGQMLPHKRPDLVIHGYHVLVTYLLPDVNLIMVGAPRLPRYYHTLQHMIAELNLPRAWLTGTVSDAQLAAFFRRADAFVTASEHEGFCAPLIEAMAMDVPVIARSFAAVPETLGGAGMLLPPDDDPMLLAEAMAEMLTNDDARKACVSAGRARMEAFDPVRARAVFLRHLMDVI
jgi:glycosyltransferase involved in cell wall biosynthesis